MLELFAFGFIIVLVLANSVSNCYRVGKMSATHKINPFFLTNVILLNILTATSAYILYTR